MIGKAARGKFVLQELFAESWRGYARLLYGYDNIELQHKKARQKGRRWRAQSDFCIGSCRH